MSDDAPSNSGFAFRSQVRAGGERVLAFLTREYRHSDAATWAARLAAGEVEVRGIPARGDEVLRAGDVVVWHRPPWREEAAPLDYAVLLEDDALVAVSKPSGLPTLPGAGFLTHTLLTQVRLRYPGASPLHRLGRGTSGAVLFARTGAAGAALSRAWREHEVGKVYRALAVGEPEWDSLELQVPIGPVPHPRLGTVFAASAEGKASRSVATVRERRAGQTLLDVAIHTGRPHQIRIHLAAAGHPLAGDPLYGPGGLPLPDLPGLPGDLGYLLHAWTLHFTHPVTGQAVRVEAPPPDALRPAPER